MRRHSPGRGRFALIVLDGVGIGEAPDAAEYGDAGSDTLGNVARAVCGLGLPFLERLGLGCCRALEGMQCEEPMAAHGVARPISKDRNIKVWTLPGSLAATTGIIDYFLFLRVLRCFSSPGSLYISYIFR